MDIPIVLIEPLSPDEEFDFIDAMNSAIERGDLSQEEAESLIAREYDLQA